MNANAKKWLTALRSGQYEQGQGKLRYGDKFCCMGVACDIYGKENGGEWDDEMFLGEAGLLPDQVQNWLGLRAKDGYVSDFRSLTSLNDTGSTFAQIADLIESEPEGLFKQETES